MAKVWYIAGGRSESGGSESGSGTSSSRRAGGPGAGTAPRCGGAGRGLPPGSGAGVPEVEVEEEGEEGAAVREVQLSTVPHATWLLRVRSCRRIWRRLKSCLRKPRGSGFVMF